MSIRVLDCSCETADILTTGDLAEKQLCQFWTSQIKPTSILLKCGFLTRMVQEKECSLFNSTAEIEEVLPNRKRNSMYVAMVAIGEKELHPSQLDPYDGKGIQGIRLTFHKMKWSRRLNGPESSWKKGIMCLCSPWVQYSYSDIELLQLVEKINALHPYAFYIVDTLGSMHRNEVSHRFYIIDENMAPEIQLDFTGTIICDWRFPTRRFWEKFRQYGR